MTRLVTLLAILALAAPAAADSHGAAEGAAPSEAAAAGAEPEASGMDEPASEAAPGEPAGAEPSEAAPPDAERGDAAPGTDATAAGAEAAPVGPAPEVARAQFTTAVRDREPTDRVERLETPTDTVFFFTELRGFQGQEVVHRWVHGGEVRAEVPFRVKGPRWRVYSSKELLPDWTGEWSVAVVDDEGDVVTEESFVYRAAEGASAAGGDAGSAEAAEGEAAEAMDSGDATEPEGATGP